MNNVTINLDNLSETDRATVMAIHEKANAPKVAGFPGVKDGETFWIGDTEFIKFPDVGGYTPVMERNVAFNSRFGDNNDLRASDILKRMVSERLPKIIAAIGEENVCEFETDLTTLDGLKPYGVMRSKVSLHTIDFYRANVDIFDKYKVDMTCWTATPESAQPHDEPKWAVCVSPPGYIRYGICVLGRIGVRPFYFFKSSIFQSCEE